MKIFVCEYITGGGLYPGVLPASLAQEGSLMREAVLRDLGQLQDVYTICPHDPRLPPADLADATVRITGEDIWAQWETCIREADAVLPIAPETGNALHRLTGMVELHGKPLLGCNAKAVEIAGSKLLTYQALQAADIDAVPTFEAAAFPVHEYRQCVAKPDDGVGCEGAILFPDMRDFTKWLAGADAGNYVVQPYIPGVAASLSLLCDQGQAWLLSCNRQKIRLDNGGFVYEGSILNAAADCWEQAARQAQQVAGAIPGLSGYIGVDAIIHGGRISILEVNPRLTTSYAGLHQALGYNPAGLLIDLLYNCRFSSSRFKMPDHIQRNEVEVSLNG